jgi:F0F1-type ATP synthase assembly protein I
VKKIDEGKKGLIKALGLVSSMGISVALAIGIGVFVGLQLDKWFGTKPWCFFLFMFFGIAAGFRNIYIIAGREIKRDDRGDQP